MRLLRFSFAFCVLALFAVSARAQISGEVYGMFSATHSHVSNTTDVEPGTTFTSPQLNSLTSYGFTLGGTVIVTDSDTHEVGIDARNTFSPAHPDGANLSFIGVKYGRYGENSRFHPYVEAGGGFMVFIANATGTSQIQPAGGLPAFPPITTTNITFHGAFGGIVGLDYKINDNLLYRAEFSAGGLTGGNYFSGSTGVVFFF